MGVPRCLDELIGCNLKVGKVSDVLEAMETAFIGVSIFHLYLIYGL